MIVANKEECCGCSACVSVCPQQCLYMKPDSEGFLYPCLSDFDVCFHCNKCVDVCPCINGELEIEAPQFGFLVQNKNAQICKESTSGGAFSALARWSLNKGGRVFGVSLNDDFEAVVRDISSEDDLGMFRRSKYVQANPKNAFKRVKEYLQNEYYVCYSGTPCQIEGLKKYLSKDYDKLITIDVVCRAVPSPMVWRKYVEMQSKITNEQIGSINFRDKNIYGYQYSNLSIRARNNELIYNNGVESDVMLRAFFSGICNRPSCYSCKFKKRFRVSDFTIWDCFDADRFGTRLEKNLGITKILIHTEKGVNVFNEISDQLNFEKADVTKIISGSHELLYSTKLNPLRELFIVDMLNNDPRDVFNKYFPMTRSVKIKRLFRRFLARLNLTIFVKTMLRKFICFH